MNFLRERDFQGYLDKHKIFNKKRADSGKSLLAKNGKGTAD